MCPLVSDDSIQKTPTDGRYPDGGCASGLTTADDGTTNMDDSTPTARCTASVCTSSFGP